MAIYHLSAKAIGRSSGRTSTGSAAYRAGERIVDDRTGLIHDYTRKSGVSHAEIMVPDGAPDWMAERALLWNGVEAIEKRKDAQLYREIEVALPRELTPAQQVEMVREFVRSEFVALGMVADVCHHVRDPEKPHAHIMLTMREIGPDGFGKKVREWNGKEQLEQWRERWGELANRALERAGLDERIDHRSYAARGLDLEPQPKLGKAAPMERRGLDTERGAEWRQVQERNLERTRLQEALAEISDRLAGLAHRAKDKIAELFGRTPQDGQKPDRVDVDALFGRKPEMDSGRGGTASQGPDREPRIQDGEVRNR